jgi:ribosomal protein S18 acetylase RimI-like enzyme
MPHVVVPINRFHDRKSFTCGKREMDDFLHMYGLTEAYGSTWVVVPHVDSTEVLAYYTLLPDPTNPLDQSEASVISLERLAVRTDLRGRGLGTELLLDIFEKVIKTVETTRFDALELQALDEEAKEWYLSRGFGFQEEEPGSLKLALPVATLQSLLENG